MDIDNNIQSLGMPTLLIVDDAAEYVNSLKNALKSEFDIVCALTLEDAKKKTDGTVDVVLADIRLDEANPDNQDGVILLEWIKNKFPDKPVVLMSAYMPDGGKALIAKGAAAFMEKPVFLTELRKLLQKLCV